MSDPFWLEMVRKTWRPFQQWGFAIAAVAYAFRPLLGYGFVVETFAALAAAGGVGFLGRTIEQASKTHSIAKYSRPVRAGVDEPEGGA